MRTSTNCHVSRICRVLLGVFLLATCVRVWIGPTSILAPAQAQIPDAGSQRFELLQEARKTNALLQQVINTLKTHTFKVQTQGTDNDKGRSSRNTETRRR